MRRRLGFLLIFGAAISLVVASTAWACGVLATLKVSSSSGTPGQQLTATGRNYSAAGNASPVQIRWNSRNGPVLQNATPDTAGNINTTFNVPANASPGWYVVMATQTVGGVPKSGTPGRTTVRVEGAAAQAAPWSSSKPAGPGGTGATVALDPAPSGSPAFMPTLLGIVLSLGLLGGGLTLIGRGRSRTATRPPLGA